MGEIEKESQSLMHGPHIGPTWREGDRNTPGVLTGMLSAEGLSCPASHFGLWEETARPNVTAPTRSLSLHQCRNKRVASTGTWMLLSMYNGERGK